MKNIPANWRAIWNYRTQITNRPTQESAEKWVAKHQAEFKRVLKIEEHPKDGWVVYCDPPFPVPKGVKLDTECVEYDLDINRMFFEGTPIPQIHDELYLHCSVQTLQRYIATRRQFEPMRWPYRRAPRNLPKDKFHFIGYYIDKGMEPSAVAVFVAFWDGQYSYYSPVGQHSTFDPGYIAQCTPISREDYLKHSYGYYTPYEYLNEEALRAYATA